MDLRYKFIITDVVIKLILKFKMKLCDNELYYFITDSWFPINISIECTLLAKYFGVSILKE